MYRYLKEESYYNDLYDLKTIKECIRVIELGQNLIKDKFNDEKIKNLSKDEKLRNFGGSLNLVLYSIQGERYRNRTSTVKEWMEADHKLDERLERAKEPVNIRCPNCFEKMKAQLKDLHLNIGKSSSVLFTFQCPKCKKRQGVYDNGEVRVSKLDLCPKCGEEVKASFKQKGNIETWIKSCSACDFLEKEVENIKEKEMEREREQKRDQNLLMKYRSEFCLSTEDGEQYIIEMSQFKMMFDSFEKDRQTKGDPNYQKAINLKKLSIVELGKFLSEGLQKQKYIKLVLEKPEIDRYVIVSFTTQNADLSRNERDSEHTLRSLIKKILETTNWRLMSEGISYRLGYLSGRLKGYEREEDLVQIVKQICKGVAG